MNYKKFIAEFRGEVLVHLREIEIIQAAFARNCKMLRTNFNQWLNSKAGMNLETFCEIYVEMGGELQDILDKLRERQNEKKKK